MKFDISKKTLIIIVSSIVGVILLWGILSVVGHGRYDRNDFGRNFGNGSCAMGQWNPEHMMSGMENIIATKDYAAFQKLFSGSRMGDMLDTPEKFAARANLQTTMKTAQDLQAKLWLDEKAGFGPMMGGGKKSWLQGCPMMGWRENERWNMTPAHRGQVRRK